MGRKLKWPDTRGTFVDQDAERAPTDDAPFEAPPGTVVEIEDADTADHYLDRGWVEASDEDDAADPDDVTTDDEPMDWDAFQSMGYQERVDAVEAGDVDHLLDRAADEDGSTNVQDAVEDRQAEIGD